MPKCHSYSLVSLQCFRQQFGEPLGNQFDAGIRLKLFSGLDICSPLEALDACLAIDELDTAQVLAFLQAVKNDCSAKHIDLPNEASAQLFITFTAVARFIEALSTPIGAIVWNCPTSVSRHESTVTDASATSTLVEHTNSTLGDLNDALNTTFGCSYEVSKRDVAFTRSISVATSTSSTGEQEAIQTRYHECVLKHLEVVRENVLRLTDVRCRIKLLEDLFSLLFLRVGDVTKVGQFVDSGEEEGELSCNTGAANSSTNDSSLCVSPSQKFYFE